jgi:hypothetical protein
MILFIKNLEVKIEALSFEVSNLSKQLEEANHSTTTSSGGLTIALKGH